MIWKIPKASRLNLPNSFDDIFASYFVNGRWRKERLSIENAEILLANSDSPLHMHCAYPRTLIYVQKGTVSFMYV